MNERTQQQANLFPLSNLKKRDVDSRFFIAIFPVDEKSNLENNLFLNTSTC